MLHKAHQDYGKLEWGTQLEPAIKLAEDGFAVSPRMASLVERMGGFVLGNDPNARAYFFQKDGTTIPEGFIRDNQPYAETLRAIQNNPPGTLTLEDMAAYQPQKTEALCGLYRQHTICGAQPPASGPIAVMSILGMLENFDMKALGQTEQAWHVFAEASALAYADRDKYIADPDFIEVPVKALIDKDYLASRAALIKSDSALSDVKAGNPVDFVRGQDATPDSPGTSHFTVVEPTRPHHANARVAPWLH